RVGGKGARRAAEDVARELVERDDAREAIGAALQPFAPGAGSELFVKRQKAPAHLGVEGRVLLEPALAPSAVFLACAEPEAQRDRLATLLDRSEVRAQLEAHGVRPADVQTRVAALTDDEVAQLAGQLDRLPAGGEGIIGALVIVFLVLLITDLLGLTKVFPFTRPVR